jgi:endonuclease/exonuclease/phosphatase family metal-dependent hydrolase
MRLDTGTGDALVPRDPKNSKTKNKVTHYMTNYVLIRDARHRRPANRNHQPPNWSHPILEDAYDIHSNNINSVTSRTRMGMLNDLIRNHAYDILFLQEVACTDSLEVAGWHVNIGSAMRGTAILSIWNIPLTNVVCLPSGRATAAIYKGLLLFNIYAPFGAAKRSESEHFYNTDLPKLLRFDHPHVLIGGDFNCVTEATDTTGHFQNSRALTGMIRVLELKDA